VTKSSTGRLFLEAGGPGLVFETWDSGTMEGRVEFHIYDVFHRLCEQYVFSRSRYRPK